MLGNGHDLRVQGTPGYLAAVALLHTYLDSHWSGGLGVGEPAGQRGSRGIGGPTRSLDVDFCSPAPALL